MVWRHYQLPQTVTELQILKETINLHKLHFLFFFKFMKKILFAVKRIKLHLFVGTTYSTTIYNIQHTTHNTQNTQYRTQNTEYTIQNTIHTIYCWLVDWYIVSLGFCDLIKIVF